MTWQKLHFAESVSLFHCTQNKTISLLNIAEIERADCSLDDFRRYGEIIATVTERLNFPTLSYSFISVDELSFCQPCWPRSPASEGAEIHHVDGSASINQPALR